MINETAARKFFGAEDPVGQVAIINRADRTIIGVVADTVHGRFEGVPMPEAYVQLGEERRSRKDAAGAEFAQGLSAARSLPAEAGSHTFIYSPSF